jgi:osmotically-inducible protein OsmY
VTDNPGSATESHSAVNPGDDVYLAKAIEGAIADDERTAELGISVSVRAGRVFLQGTVASAGRKATVAHVAAERAANHQIVNEITVVDVAEQESKPTRETLQ